MSLNKKKTRHTILLTSQITNKRSPNDVITHFVYVDKNQN